MSVVFKKIKASVVEDGIIVKFPLSVGKKLKIENGSNIHFTIVDGIMQCSVKEPKVGIPILTEIEEAFEKQA